MVGQDTQKHYQSRAGLGHVPAYQASSIPFLSASIPVAAGGAINTVSFPTVTKFLVIKNTGANTIRFGFSDNGVDGTNYNTLDSGDSFSADFRVVKLHLRDNGGGASTVEVAAGLTTIFQDQLKTNWSGTTGVG